MPLPKKTTTEPGKIPMFVPYDGLSIPYGTMSADEAMKIGRAHKLCVKCNGNRKMFTFFQEQQKVN
jgi:hypothetical protein